MKTEIFRHLRPHQYNPRIENVEPMINGGISFMLQPVGEKQYDYWISICPLDCSFSAKQAVKNLREAAERGVVPWGTMTLTDDPLINQLENDVMNEYELIHSEIVHLVKSIRKINMDSAIKMLEVRDYEKR
jgi:hypothetical protein